MRVRFAVAMMAVMATMSSSTGRPSAAEKAENKYVCSSISEDVVDRLAPSLIRQER